MRKSLAVVILLGLLIALLSSCSINALRPFPYGIWENTELGLVLDITPEVCQTDRFSGTLIEDGKKIDVYIWICDIHGALWILSEPEWPYSAPILHESTMFSGRYRLRGDQLHYTLESRFREMTGITETIVFEKIHEYEVPD